MKIDITPRIDTSPRKRTIKVFALLPKRLYGTDGKIYLVWLEYYMQEEQRIAREWRIESNYPILTNKTKIK